ncbi:hypothetical protein ATCC90586_011623 [Pythium insidiosum]|nr:hypothetical protein ATCC90586_011623 [Pythium insidiosum]
MKKPDDLLGNDNYFHWEFNMRMTLARKGLLNHIEGVKMGAELTDEWRAKDMKAYAIIAQGIEVEHQSKIRHTATAKDAWAALRDYYVKRSLQNRVALTRRLHEFRMEEGSNMASHLDRFDELVLSMEAVGDKMDEARQLTILLGSLPQEYETLVTIIENSSSVSMVDVKEKLLKEYEKRQQQESTEGAFRARHHQQKNGPTDMHQQGTYNGGKKKKKYGFKGKCHRCNKVGHKAFECRSKPRETTENETAFAAYNDQSQGWLLDSGASSHMTPSREDYVEYEKLVTPIIVKIADGASMKATGRGSVRFRCGNGEIVTVKDVLHIPTLDRRLLSIPKVTQRGLDVKFGATHCSIWKEDKLVISAKRNGNAYVLNVEHEHAMYISHVGATSEWELWHARSGHPSHKNYQLTQAATEGMPIIGSEPQDLCGGCLKGKMTVESFPKASTTVTTQPLEIVRSDVMGPMKTRSVGGARYVVSFIDDFTGLVKVYFLKAKSEVPTKFTEYKSEMELQCGTKIKILHTDNGGEYKNKRMKAICQKSGIIHQKTVPHSPQQNGMAERMNRTIVEKARSMMHYKGTRT